MNKGIISVCIKNRSDINRMELIRDKFKSSDKYNDYKLIMVVSGNTDMKDNIIEVAKARLNTWSFLINRNYFKNQQVRKQYKV